MDESEEARCQLIKPGSDPPILLQFVEEAFHQMPFLVLEVITEPWINGIRFWRNAEISIPVGDVLPETIRAISLISLNDCIIQIHMIQNIISNVLIMNVSGGKLDVNWVSQCVHHRMDLGISTTASDPNALIFLESLAFSIDFWGSFGGVRISLFLHLHWPYGL